MRFELGDIAAVVGGVIDPGPLGAGASSAWPPESADSPDGSPEPDEAQGRDAPRGPEMAHGLDAAEVVVNGAGIDTRTIGRGELFVAVKAERDGHEFCDAAHVAGAAAVLSDRPAGVLPTVVVGDVAAALDTLARVARARLSDRVVGITGSVGKTSAKDLARAAFAAGLRTHASEKSFNNELGVPLTLLNAPDDAEAVIVEMGARGPGHIARLCLTASPTVGVVTTVGIAHTELFGSVEAVISAKSELVIALPPDGTAVLNAEVPAVAAMADRTRASVLTFGVGVGDVRASHLDLDEMLRASFHLDTPWGSTDVQLAVAGQHQVSNALAAAGAALACDVALEDVAAGLAEGALSPWRMEVTTLASGAVLVNDAYNANPTSTAAALHALAQLPATRRIAVLGVMAELGSHHEAEHRAIAELAESLGIELVAVGVGDYGVPPAPDVDAAGELFAAGGRFASLGPGDAVLVKGSRVAALERLAATLAGR